MLLSKLIITELFVGRHLLHRTVPYVSLEMVFLRKGKVPRLQRHMESLPTPFPTDVERAGVLTGWGEVPFKRNKNIDPQAVVLLVRDLVVQVRNSKRKA